MLRLVLAPLRKLVDGIAALIAVVFAFGNWKRDQ